MTSSKGRWMRLSVTCLVWLESQMTLLHMAITVGIGRFTLSYRKEGYIEVTSRSGLLGWSMYGGNYRGIDLNQSSHSFFFRPGQASVELMPPSASASCQVLACVDIYVQQLEVHSWAWEPAASCPYSRSLGICPSDMRWTCPSQQSLCCWISEISYPTRIVSLTR